MQCPGALQPAGVFRQRRQRHAARPDIPHVARCERKLPVRARGYIPEALVPLALAAQHGNVTARRLHTLLRVLHQQGQMPFAPAASVHAHRADASHAQGCSSYVEILYLQAVQPCGRAVLIQHRMQRRAVGARPVQLGQQRGEIHLPLRRAERLLRKRQKLLQLLRLRLFQMNHPNDPFPVLLLQKGRGRPFSQYTTPLAEKPVRAVSFCCAAGKSLVIRPSRFFQNPPHPRCGLSGGIPPPQRPSHGCGRTGRWCSYSRVRPSGWRQILP